MSDKAVETRILPNGDRLDVLSMLYGNGRLTFTYADTPSPDLQYDGCWCYETVALAIVAQETWDGTGEPTGWKRHPESGRRRPDGDASKEYVNP